MGYIEATVGENEHMKMRHEKLWLAVKRLVEASSLQRVHSSA